MVNRQSVVRFVDWRSFSLFNHPSNRMRMLAQLSRFDQQLKAFAILSGTSGKFRHIRSLFQADHSLVHFAFLG